MILFCINEDRYGFKILCGKKRKKAGIYLSWDECKSMVHGFAGAEYKSFSTRQEAEEYINGDKFSDLNSKSEAYAYVDGSFNTATGVYGYGGFIVLVITRKYLWGAEMMRIWLQ